MKVSRAQFPARREGGRANGDDGGFLLYAMTMEGGKVAGRVHRSQSVLTSAVTESFLGADDAFLVFSFRLFFAKRANGGAWMRKRLLRRSPKLTRKRLGDWERKVSCGSLNSAIR